MAVDVRLITWPLLESKYLQPLNDAVAFIVDRFDVAAVAACGTIIRGTPHANSDLDMYVVNRANFRQRLQRFFGSVPAEIFVNPEYQIRAYFTSEHRNARPLTAHMVATGFIIYDPDGVMSRLQAEARTLLSQPPTPARNETLARYLIATLYEDAMDTLQTDPQTSRLLLNRCLWEVLQYYFTARPGYVPRSKDLLRDLAVSGIDEYHAELLPEEKVAAIERMAAEQSDGGGVAFVGDGLNDAPVLMHADVGIAMGALGSDAAIEAADVVLMDDRLDRVPAALRIAHRTRRIVYQNITLALAAKAAFLVLGTFGVATMWEAVIGDVGVSLLAVLNATRTFRLQSGTPMVKRSEPGSSR